MGKVQPSPPSTPRLSSKRKVSGPSSQSKRRRSDEDIQPGNNSSDASTSSTHFFIPQFVANGFRRLSYAWSGARSPSPRNSTSRGEAVSEVASAAAAAAEEAEVATIVRGRHGSASVDPPSPVNQKDEGDTQLSSPAKALDVERRFNPAYELRGHIRCRVYLAPYIREGLNRCSVLDSSDFDDIYEQFCDTRNIRTLYRDPVPFKLFSSVITTYGETLGPDHNCIDWDLVTEQVGAQAPSNSSQSLEALYFERIAPIVAVWVREVDVAMAYVRIERDFPAIDIERRVPSVATIRALSSALSDIADALGDVEASCAVANLIAGFKDTEPAPQSWLETAASSEAVLRIAGEIPETPCQLLVDWVDAALATEDPLKEQALLFRLYTETVRASGILPTRLRMYVDEFKLDSPHSRSAGMSLYSVRLHDVLRTVCCPIRADAHSFLGELWRAYQKHFVALAIWSRLHHPNLMPLLGLVPSHKPICFVVPSISLVPRHYPFRPFRPLRSSPESDSDDESASDSSAEDTTPPHLKAIDRVMLQISEAFQYLHERDVVHGDVQWQNIIVSHDKVAIWNFGFYRTEFTESAENARSDYAAPDSHFREPTKEDDIYGCAMLFLSLAFAAASPAHIEQRLGTDGFGLCATRFSMIRSKRWVVPEMPAIFRKLPCFTPDGGEQLWLLIVDMVKAYVDSSLTMDAVTSRLRASLRL